MVSAVLLAALLIVSGGHAFAADGPNAAAQAALAWLKTRQQADGSFQGFDAGASADAISAFAAAGVDPNTLKQSGKSALDYLVTQAKSYGTKSPASAGKLTLAVVAAGNDPRSFGGQNLLDVLTNSYDSQAGRYGTTPTDHAFAVLALVSAGQPVASAAAQGFTAAQLADGGWSYDGTAATGSDTNTTGLVMQALAAAKLGGSTMTKAVAYLRTQQNADGGFPYAKPSQYGSDSDANSTAYAIQGFLAAGTDPATVAQGANTPLTALVTFQNKSGALRFQTAQPDDNDLATAQAVPALLLKTMPFVKATLPAAVPASLPATGSARDSAIWLWLPALVLLLGGLLVRRRA